MKPELKKDIQELLWMACRYADGRQTYAPEMFNNIQKRMIKLGVEPNGVDREGIWARDHTWETAPGSIDN